MKKISTFILACLLSFSLFAGEKDDFSFGIKAGVMFAGHNDEYTKTLPSGSGIGNLKKLVGPQFGFIFEIPVMQYLEIRPELNFSSQGFRFKENDDAFSSWLGYIQVPVLIRGQYGSEKVRGFVHVGPQVGVGLFNFTRSVKDGEVLDKESYSFKDQKLNPIDVGMAFGAGVEFPAAKGLEVEVRYSTGFTDINDNEANPIKRTNNALTLSLGIKF